jgi:hypothetical protein
MQVKLWLSKALPRFAKSAMNPGSLHAMKQNRLLAALAPFALLAPCAAHAAPPVPAPPPPSYADLADLADSAQLIARVKVDKAVRVAPARAPCLRPGWARFFVQAKTLALLTGASPVGAKLRYLVDAPLGAKGKVPKIAKQTLLVFARPVADRPGELQLVAPDGQLAWSAETEARLRGVILELITPEAPTRITGVREAIHVPGTLTGVGETQIFLTTADDSAASVSVLHKAGSPPRWGVSFSEVMASVGAVPPRESLAWYRLACFLPASLPQGANLSEGGTSRAQAESDYRMVLGELGDCPRTRQ